MNRKRILFILSVLILVALLAAALVLFLPGSRWAIHGPSTNDVYYYDDGAPPADPAVVGTWQNVQNPRWFKVYYDDYDGDGYYWGKEWDEAEEVFEEDLSYHGNGWFRWKREGKTLTELHRMDINETVIPKVWNLKTKPDSLLLFPQNNKKVCDRFGRVLEE